MYPKSKFFTFQIPYANKYKWRNLKVEKNLFSEGRVAGWGLEK